MYLLTQHISFMLQNLVIVSVINQNIFVIVWATLVKCLVVFSPWQSTMEIKADICWEESTVHRKKVYEHLYFFYSKFVFVRMYYM